VVIEEGISVTSLDTPRQLERRAGRPRKLKMPPLPEELLAGLSALEREHFDFFVEAYQHDYPQMSPSDCLCLYQAALEYINLLRVQATQLTTKQVISMARQHPGVQLRQWLDSMSCTRKARLAGRSPSAEDQDRASLKELLKGLSS
jgi:hypothetical protein